MFDRLKHLKDEIRAHIPGAVHEQKPAGMDDQCLAELRMVAQSKFPKLPTWHEVNHDRQLLFPIHLVPLPGTLPPSAEPFIEELKNAMLLDGVLHSHVRLHSHYEHLQAHIWIATLAPGSHVPIGILIFNKEMQAAEGQQPGVSTVATQWWLSYAWLTTVERGKHIFRNSLPYMSEWHRGFQVQGPTPALRRALKEHPDYICDPQVSWA